MSRQAVGERSDWIVCLALTLLATALRAYQLGAHSLWLDELLSWSQSADPSLDSILGGFPLDVAPPGHALVLAATQSLLGDAEWALRLPSAIAGVLLVPTLYWLGRRLYGSAGAAFAALLVTISWSQIYYSQEARAYSMMALAAALLLQQWWGLVEILRRADRVPALRMLGFVAAGTFLVYLHYFGLLYVGALALVTPVSLRSIRGLRVAALAFGAIGLAFLPWLPEFSSDLELRDFWIPRPKAFPLEATEFVWANLGASRSLPHFALLGSAVLVGLGLEIGRAARAHGRAFSEWPRELRATGVFALLVAVVFVAVYVRSVLATPVLTERNLLVCLPAISLIAGHGLRGLALGSTGRSLVFAVVLLLSLDRLVVENFWANRQMEDWRGASAVIVEGVKRLPGQHRLILFTYGEHTHEYYLRPAGGRWSVDLRAGEATDIGLLEAWLAGEPAGPLWYLAAHRVPDPEFLQALDAHFPRARWWRFQGARVALLSPPGRR